MHPARLLSIPLLVKCHWLFRRFTRAAGECRAAQERVLLSKLRRNADSAFGREHRFDSLRSVEDFRARLPLRDYEDVRPWIDRVKRGEARALFGPSERVLMFAVTSGTEGDAKFLPVTASFLREYNRGWHLWGIAAERTHREAYDHTICRLISPADESHTEGGIPCGAISGFITEGLPWYIRSKYTPPAPAADVKHAPSKYYLIARLSVVRNVSMLSAANPSTVLAVVRAADEHRERIVRDVRDGTIDATQEVPPETRKRLAGSLRPDPRRARELEDVIRRTGRLLPKDYWPQLDLLANWKGGPCRLYLAQYGEYFGDTAVRDIGLLASEGRMTLPFSDEGASGVLDVTSHFFEFIPEAEAESERPATLLAHELEAGGRYFLVVTTSGGLCRYKLFDLVRVTGFFGRTPEVEFLNKGTHFSSITGEKVSEFQVVEALSQARGALGWGPVDGLFSPMSGETVRYSLAVEAHGEKGVGPLLPAGPEGASHKKCPTPFSPDWHAFLAEFDRRLRALNVEYESRRASQRLGPPVLHLLVPGAFERIKDQHVERMKGRREQYKHRFISGELDLCRKLPVAEAIQMKQF